jgi:DNA-directed RNA polymerase sigma subunit (sigma70/sigma32)
MVQADDAPFSPALTRITATNSDKFVLKVVCMPMPEELAEKLGMPIENARKVLKVAKEPIPLETPIGDEEDSHLGDFIEDKNAVLPIDAAIQSNLRETTTRVLASLTPREERVLRMRFGIGMNTTDSIVDAGQSAGQLNFDLAILTI